MTPRILLVTPSAPLPETRGGNQRTNLLIRALQRVGSVEVVYVHWDLQAPDPDLLRRFREEFGLVEVVPVRGGPTGGAWRRLTWKARALSRLVAARAGLIAPMYAVDRGVRDAVRRRLEEVPYDLVVVRYLQTAAVAEPFGSVPVVVDADDFELSRFEIMTTAGSLPVWERVGARLALRFVRRRVPALLRKAAHLWVPNSNDRRRLEAFPVSVLPNVPFSPPRSEPAPAPDEPRILLVASLRYEVNIRSVEFFVRRIWPRIRAGQPAAEIRIVGTGMSDRLRESWGAIEGVEAAGFVEDLSAEYARSAFTVAPVFHGGGTKIKVLEALAHRRACVVTPHVLSGFEGDLADGTGIAVADGPDVFAGVCTGLLADPEQARRVADCGYEAVRRRFSHRRFEETIESTVRTLVPR